MRKGILLAGGNGTRLRPLTAGVSKQLLPVYDKPLIYYSLTTLMLAGVREILIIVDVVNRSAFERLLGDGTRWGISLLYATQESPRGLADALLIAEEFLSGSPSVMVLGDNIFYGKGFGRDLLQKVSDNGASATGIHVDDPREFGVIEIGANSEVVGLEEKPSQPKSNYAIPGLYFFDGTAPSRARALSPSQRGELEITDLLRSYLSDKSLSVEILPRGTTWLDAGSIDGLLGAGELIRTLQKNSGQLVGSPEEAAWRQGWISKETILSLASEINTTYGRMLERTVNEEERAG